VPSTSIGHGTGIARGFTLKAARRSTCALYVVPSGHLFQCGRLQIGRKKSGDHYGKMPCDKCGETEV
jgi:hypothetical protein